MPAVRDNLEEIHNMFPEIELTEFLNARLDHPSETVVDYILENHENFQQRRKRVRPKTPENEHERTLNISEVNTGNANAVFAEPLDIANPEIVSFFDALANHFEQVAQTQQPVAFSAEQISDLVQFFSKKFIRVRLPTCRWLCTSTNPKCMLDAILVVLFFVDNQAIEIESFNRILEALVNTNINKTRRNSLVGPGAINAIRTKLDPLIKSRRFINKCQLKNPALGQQVEEAIQKFETVLVQLVKSAHKSELTESQSKAAYKNTRRLFEPIRWMGKPVIHLTREHFECMVCFSEFPVSKAFYCTETVIVEGKAESNDVHPFCLECVQGQAEASINEALLSDGALGLRCMDSDCKNPILFSKIRLYLSHALRDRLDKRITSQALCSAGLSNLEYCSRCDFAMVMEDAKEVNKVFHCQSCGFSYCRICEEDWSKHFGLSCKELKEKSEEAKRREIENKLSEAIVRCCPRCHLQLVKLDACNKMTCRCGMHQCYICREVGITYDHFCNHVRDPNNPNKKCEQCKVPRCLLWEDFKKRDQEAVENILKDADVNVNIPKSPQPGTSNANHVQFAPIVRPPAPNVVRPPMPPRGPHPIVAAPAVAQPAPQAPVAGGFGRPHTPPRGPHPIPVPVAPLPPHLPANNAQNAARVVLQGFGIDPNDNNVRIFVNGQQINPNPNNANQ